uniref:P-loop ATPase, Sll1717 family n=1 Tax=uncultured Clostridium sp. TaxID=59620 RepID=UPI0025FFC9C9
SSEVAYTTDLNINETYMPKEYYEHLHWIYDILIKIFKNKNTITLIYDDLDSIDTDVKFDSFHVELLNGLIAVANKINLEISSKSKSKSKIILILREDMIDYMQDYTTNLNKITSSNKVRLYWLNKKIPDKPYEHPLMELILNKIKNSEDTYKECSNKDLYKRLFGAKIGSQTQIDFLLDHSFGRPRDIIKFLNIIRETYKQDTYFKANRYKKCLLDYSNWFYDELRNEISIYNNSEVLKQSIELIKSINKISFDINDIDIKLEKNKDYYPDITDSQEVVDNMYKLGIIGLSYEKGNKHYKYYAYRDDGRKKADMKATFVVHNALRRAFGLFSLK